MELYESPIIQWCPFSVTRHIDFRFGPICCEFKQVLLKIPIDLHLGLLVLSKLEIFFFMSEFMNYNFSIVILIRLEENAFSGSCCHQEEQTVQLQLKEFIITHTS